MHTTQLPQESDHSPNLTSSAPPPETLRCSGTADFLAALPLLTGFTDQNSIFLVLFQGSRGGSVLRMKLPETQAPHEISQLLDGVIALLHDTGAGPAGPAIVIATSQQFSDTIGAPWGRLSHQLKRRFRREGWSLRELAVIAGDGWCGMLGNDAGRPRPLSEITESEFAHAVRARVPAPRSLASIGALPHTDAARAKAVAQYLDTLKPYDALSGHTFRADHSTKWLRKTAALAERCYNTTAAHTPHSAPSAPSAPLRANTLARFISAAQSHTPWLVLVLTAMTRAEFVVSVALETSIDRLTDIRIDHEPEATPGTRDGWSIEHLLCSLAHELPERAKLRSVVHVLEDAIAHSPDHMRPPLLAFHAWAWWMLGMQSVAARSIAQSLALLNDHKLTRMVQRLIDNPPAGHLHRLRTEFDHVAAA